MNKPLLAFALVALAGIGVGQATTSFVPIARWLGFYQRQDISQFELWTPYTSGNVSTAIFPVTERILVTEWRCASNDLYVDEIDANGNTVQVLLRSAATDQLRNSGGLLVEPGMWGVDNIGLRLSTEFNTGPSGSAGAYVLYKGL